MKQRIQSFSFLMELILVIFFFSLATTVCASFIVKAKEKQENASAIQNSLLEAQSMIETMQANPQKSIDDLFDVNKVGENQYQKDYLLIEMKQEKSYYKGQIRINVDNDSIILPFVVGGNTDE